MSERVNDPTAGIFPGVMGDRTEWGACGCATCVAAVLAERPFPQNLCHPFIVCPDCGNKRCPRATHHDHDCTDSNEPGQPGSRFEAAPSSSVTEGGDTA